MDLAIFNVILIFMSASIGAALGVLITMMHQEHKRRREMSPFWYYVDKGKGGRWRYYVDYHGELIAQSAPFGFETKEECIAVVKQVFGNIVECPEYLKPLDTPKE